MVQQTAIFDDKLIFIDSFIDPLFALTPFHLCTVGFDHKDKKVFIFLEFPFYSQSPMFVLQHKDFTFKRNNPRNVE